MKKVIINLLKELRLSLLIWLFFVFIGFIFCYINKNYLYTFITDPITSIFNKKYNSLFIYTSIFESFTADLLVSFFSSIIISLPVLFICIYWFFSKSLYLSEKKIFAFSLFLSFVLTVCSIFMVYYFLLPRFVNFFVFDADNAKPMLKIIDYVRTFFCLIFATSLIFQFPIILLIFAKFGLVKKNILTKNRKIAILIIFIISAIITPPDVVSQIFIASIIILIYEITNYWLKQCIKK